MYILLTSFLPDLPPYRYTTSASQTAQIPVCKLACLCVCVCVCAVAQTQAAAADRYRPTPGSADLPQRPGLNQSELVACTWAANATNYFVQLAVT